MPAATPERDVAPRLASLDDERRDYHVEPPRSFNAVTSTLDGWADDDPTAVALLSVGPDGDVVARQTVADLVDESRRMAGALTELGVGRGDRVLVMLPRVPAWYTAALGVIRLGAVAAPTPNLSTARDLQHRLERSGAVAVVTDTAGAAKIDAIEGPLPALRERVCWSAGGTTPDGWRDLTELLSGAAAVADPDSEPTTRDDPMLLFFTSGTVGRSKMVEHAHSYALGHVATARFWHDLRPGDVHWTVSDTGWAKAAWGGLFGQWHERATVFQAAIERPTADAILGTLAAHGVTSFCAPPTLYRALVQADLGAYELTTLRHCTSAGEPLNPEVIRAWSDGTGGLTIYDGYGQTESTLLVANFRTLELRPGSMGKPVPGYDVAVVDRDGNRAAAGEVGSIAVSISPRWPVGLFHGYAGADRDAGAFRDGWYHTGDTGYVDADGYLWFEGRSDDVITSSAYRIGPFEVESALVEHPAVMEAAVVGRDDPDRTQIVCAFVILAEGFEASDELATELQDHVKATTAPYKYPREVIFARELPKTVSGKIRRSELRERMKRSAP